MSDNASKTRFNLHDRVANGNGDQGTVTQLDDFMVCVSFDHGGTDGWFDRDSGLLTLVAAHIVEEANE